MKKEKGQSLIEVIIALGVAVLVILALVRVTIIAIRNARYAKNKALATQHAQRVLETIRAYRDENTWAVFTRECEAKDMELMSIEMPPQPFNITFDDCVDNSIGDDDSRDVMVTVFWTDGGKTHGSTLETRLGSWK